MQRVYYGSDICWGYTGSVCVCTRATDRNSLLSLFTHQSNQHGFWLPLTLTQCVCVCVGVDMIKGQFSVCVCVCVFMMYHVSSHMGYNDNKS